MENKTVYNCETGVKYTVYLDDEGFYLKYKINTKVPRQWYYSFVNDVESEIHEMMTDGKIKKRPPESD